MELEVAVPLVPAAPRQEAVEVSILRLSVRSGFHTHTKLDPMIISDDESSNAESETDCSNLEVDLTTKNDSFSPHIADHQDDEDNSSVVNGATLQLAADLPMSASSGHGSVTHQGPIRVNSEITQGSDVGSLLSTI